jgi:hypothetical protein
MPATYFAVMLVKLTISNNKLRLAIGAISDVGHVLLYFFVPVSNTQESIVWSACMLNHSA